VKCRSFDSAVLGQDDTSLDLDWTDASSASRTKATANRGGLRCVQDDDSVYLLLVAVEAEFSGGAVGSEVVGKMEGGASSGGYGGRADGGVGLEAGEGEEAGGFVEAEAGSDAAGRGAEDSAAEGWVEGTEAVEFDGDGGFAGGGADGAATSSDWFAGEQELREDSGEFGLPAGLFFSGEFGEVGKGLVYGGVEGSELGEEFVADAVASEGGVGVGGVFAPRLVRGFEEGFDVGATGLEEGAEDFAFWLGEDWVDGGEAFGPGSAKELHEDGFGLVVEGVGGEDGVGVAGVEEGGEEFVAGVAGGFFDPFVCGGDAFGDVGLVKVEGDVESDAEVLDELLVGVGFFGAEVMVDVDGGEAHSEGVAGGGIGGVEGEEEGYGVGSAGDCDGDAVSGFDVGAVERKREWHRTYVSWLRRRNSDKRGKG